MIWLKTLNRNFLIDRLHTPHSVLCIPSSVFSYSLSSLHWFPLYNGSEDNTLGTRLRSYTSCVKKATFENKATADFKAFGITHIINMALSRPGAYFFITVGCGMLVLAASTVICACIALTKLIGISPVEGSVGFIGLYVS